MLPIAVNTTQHDIGDNLFILQSRETRLLMRNNILQLNNPVRYCHDMGQ